MVTDEMVEKAANAIAEKRGYVWPGTFDAEEIKIGRENMRAALEAALSAAEPVDYQLVFSDGRTSRVLYSKDEADRFKKASDITVDIRALYAAPPAPSVAVNDDMRKEFAASARAMFLLAANGPDDDLRDGMRELYARMFRVLNGLSPSALSAQVQDVAGWQLVPTEPTDDMIEAFRQAHARKCVDIASHTPTEHPEDGGGPIGYGYRAMLAAAPAKQEGGKSNPMHKQSVDSGESGDE